MPRVRTAQEAGFGNSQLAALPNAAQQEQRLNVSADMFGGAAAKQLSQVGAQLDNAADSIVRSNYYNAKLQKQNDTLEATNLDNQMQKEALDMQYNPETGFYAAKGAAAVGLSDEAAKKLDALREKYVGQASNPQAAALFEKSFGKYRNSVLESVSRHSLTQSGTYLTDTVKARTSLNAEKAGLQYNDDQAFGQFLSDNTSAVVALASREGWSPDKFRDELWKSNSTLYRSRAYTMLNSSDPKLVKQGAEFYQGAVERGDLTMDDVKALDSLRDTAYPRALASEALATIGGGPQAFNTAPAESVFDGMIQQESGGRQFAGPGVPLTSSAGAIGIAQVMPATAPEAARLAGLPWDEQKYKNDPEYNKALGKAYHNMLTTKYGDNTLATLAYNWGPGSVDNHIAKMGDPRTGAVSYDRFLASIPSKEAREYVPKVQRRMGMTGSGTQIIDAGTASAKAAELEAQFPGSGTDFLAMVDKQNKIIEDAKKASDAELVAEGAKYMQESNGDIASVPPELKAKLINAGKWDEVSKYTGASDRKSVITLDSMSDEEFAGVDLASYTTKLSQADMEQRLLRQRTLRNGDEGYKAYSTQRGTYWMAIAGEDAGKSSEDKARFQEMTDRRFEAFKKENKRAPNREEARIIFQSISSDANGKKLYQQPSDAKVLTDSGYESTDIERYNGILAANNFDVTEKNQELLRTNPQAVIGPVDGVPSEKILPIIDRLTRGGLPATAQNVREYYQRDVAQGSKFLGLALDAVDLITGRSTKGTQPAPAPQGAYPKIGG